jgi:hypothetical protein
MHRLLGEQAGLPQQALINWRPSFVLWKRALEGGIGERILKLTHRGIQVPAEWNAVRESREERARRSPMMALRCSRRINTSRLEPWGRKLRPILTSREQHLVVLCGYANVLNEPGRPVVRRLSPRTEDSLRTLATNPLDPYPNLQPLDHGTERH